jgi:hypothetical protein
MQRFQMVQSLLPMCELKAHLHAEIWSKETMKLTIVIKPTKVLDYSMFGT